jgi:hypothetical protein
MFIKLTNGSPESYTIGQLRRDNPNTSFPKNIPAETLASYDVHPVKAVAAPDFDSKTHRVSQDVQLVDDEWTQVWSVVELPLEQAEQNIRGHRAMLLKETDWMALSDNTMTPAWAAYRQALRDITSQEGFPYNVNWPDKVE